MPPWVDFEPFIVSGLALGGVYALSGVGLVVLYRATGVLNLAYGAVGAMGYNVGEDAARRSEALTGEVRMLEALVQRMSESLDERLSQLQSSAASSSAIPALQGERRRRQPAPDHLAEHALDARVGIERALRLGAGHAGDLVEHADDRLTAPVKCLPHLGDGGQVPGHGG